MLWNPILQEKSNVLAYVSPKCHFKKEKAQRTILSLLFVSFLAAITLFDRYTQL